MPSDNTPAGDARPTPPQSTGPVPALRQRDPPSFSGTGNADILDWLDTYERVSRYNKWGDDTKLNNVVFYLTDLAKTWFLNHEQELVTWDAFSTRAQELFGRPAYRRADAELKLSQRIQAPDEPYTSYIEDVLTLCSRVDKDMAESEKIKHVLKGIREDGFQLLVTKAPTTVNDVVFLCRSLQDARYARIQPLSPPSTTLMGAMPVASSPPADINGLRSIIRDIIREELVRAGLAPMSAASGAQDPCCNFLQSLVREELAQSLPAPVTTPSARPTYADVLKHSPLQQRTPAPPLSPQEVIAPVAGFYGPQGPRETPTHRQTETRTCFYCGIRGHIARYCRRRRRDLQYTYQSPVNSSPAYTPTGDSYAPPIWYTDPPEPRRAPSPGHPGSHLGTPSGQRRRSVSPYPGRSPARRPARSRSPAQPENQ